MRRLVALGIALALLALPSHTIASSHRYAHVCGAAPAHAARCNADVVKDANGVPLVTSIPMGYGPVQFHMAYNLPSSAPTGQTIGIVDAFSAPNVEADLATYDAQFGLPACTIANGCLRIDNRCIEHKSYGHHNQRTCGSYDAGWEEEVSLDVQIAHGICQTCVILLVESDDNSFVSMTSAENQAVLDGAIEISNSWSANEFSGQMAYDSTFAHSGVAITASSGDGGYGTQWPASSPTVIAVGGTTLQLNADNTYNNEAAWSGSGSGCSLYELADAWQRALPNWSATGCGMARAVTDVAADANPFTGAAIYDSNAGGWLQVGGTSLASPIITSTIALAGGTASYANASQVPYLKMTPTNSHDITVGTNGFCVTVMCNAGTSYDGPTGLGTPNGMGGF
jgi:subtilase family serine protease